MNEWIIGCRNHSGKIWFCSWPLLSICFMLWASLASSEWSLHYEWPCLKIKSFGLLFNPKIKIGLIVSKRSPLTPPWHFTMSLGHSITRPFHLLIVSTPQLCNLPLKLKTTITTIMIQLKWLCIYTIVANYNVYFYNAHYNYLSFSKIGLCHSRNYKLFIELFKMY